jgi:hypothetical protein
MAVAAGVALAALAATATTPPQAPRPSVELQVTLDAHGGHLAGRARLRFVNTSDRPIADVPLWLYPNHLATRAPGLSDVSFHWLYPGLFSPGSMNVWAVRGADGPAAFALEDTAAGARTVARVALPAPVAPGGAVVLDVSFSTYVPRRFGAFGCDGPRCRLMGGFYPTPAHLGRGGWELAAPPDAVDARVTVVAEPGVALVVDGEPMIRADPTRDDAVTIDSAGVPYATIITDRALRVAAADVAGVPVRVLHRKPRPPDSSDQPLPYVREDVPGMILATARGALEILRAHAPARPGARPVTLVEAPLRHELVQVHGGVVLVSDQIFGIFPLGRLRKYHRFELARAVLTAAIDDVIAATERPEDRDLAAGVLAAYLTDVYALHVEKKIEYAKDLLRPFDFIPAVDQLMYAPLLASSQSYFGDVDGGDLVRDDVRRFSGQAPSPRLLYSKLVDLLGATGMARLARATLAEGTPLRRAAADAFGGDLDWFWRQWLGPRPHVNYRLDAVHVEPRAGLTHVTIDVAREGDDIREPVEVRVLDRAGGARTLVWSERGPRRRFEVDLPAGLASVEVDPRERLVETAVGSLGEFDDPRSDNRRPQRWRFLYEGFGGLLNLSQLTANFAAVFVLKPQHDLHNEIILRAFHNEALTAGAGALYARNFGPQVDRNTLASSLFAGAAVSRPNPTFGLAPGQAPQPGWRLDTHVGFDHDTRDYIIDPWRAVGLDVGAGYSLTALENGTRLGQVNGGVEALRLFELLPGHVLALDVDAAATAGDLRLPVQLTSAGGPAGLRGYQADELLGRARVIGRVQLRDDYVTELDWNLLHFTTVRALAGTLFADAAAITSCDGYDFSRRNVYYDVGYSFRVLHDAFGVYQQLLSIDVAVPLNRHPPAAATCLGAPVTMPARPPVTVLISFLPNF